MQCLCGPLCTYPNLYAIVNKSHEVDHGALKAEAVAQLGSGVGTITEDANYIC
jgi:hypothetical protein